MARVIWALHENSSQKLIKQFGDAMLFQVLNSKFDIVLMFAVDVGLITKFLRPITIVNDIGWLGKFLFLSIDEVVDFLFGLEL